MLVARGWWRYFSRAANSRLGVAARAVQAGHNADAANQLGVNVRDLTIFADNPNTVAIAFRLLRFLRAHHFLRGGAADQGQQRSAAAAPPREPATTGGGKERVDS